MADILNQEEIDRLLDVVHEGYDELDYAIDIFSERLDKTTILIGKAHKAQVRAVNKHQSLLDEKDLIIEALGALRFKRNARQEEEQKSQ